MIIGNTLWLALAALAAAALLPLVLALRRPAAPRGAEEAALALHRAQLAEIDRDLADGRLEPAEHAAATLEIQRRLLAADAAGCQDSRVSGRGAVITVLLLVPVAAFGLYLLGGQPELAGTPLAARIAEERDADTLIAALRGRLAAMNPADEKVRQGYILLGNAEASRGRMADAAQAWRTALAARFDAGLAVQVAEAQSRVEGKVSADSAALFRRALAEAPPDAPWRGWVQRRLEEAP